VTAIEIDSRKDIVVGGKFRGELTLPPKDGLVSYSASDQDAFLIKFDPDGKVLWSRVISSTGNDAIWDIEVLDKDDIVVGGTSGGIAYVARLASSGEILWETRLADVPSSFARGVASDDEGRIYVGGAFTGTMVFPVSGGGRRMSSQGRDMFLGRLEANGQTLEWVSQLGNGSRASLYGVAADEDGVFITGYFKQRLDADPGAGVSMVGSGTGMDSFVAKFDRSGRHLWSASPNSTGNEMSTSLVVADGHVYVGGQFTHTLSGRIDDRVQTVSAHGRGTEWDMFVAAYSSYGDLELLQSLGTGGEDRLYRLARASSGGILVAGVSKDRPVISRPLHAEASLTLTPNDAFHAPRFFGAVAEIGEGFAAGGASSYWPYNTDGELMVGYYRPQGR
jgi:hypothetical protein